MSNDDYKAGLRGDPYSPTMDRQAYDDGASVYNAQQAIMGSGIPKSNITAGPGFVLAITSPILAFMYPVGGFLAIGALLAVKGITQALPAEPPFIVLLLLMITVGVSTFFLVSIKAERIVSRFKIYRILRHLFRMAALGAITFKMIIAAGNPAARKMSIAQTFDSASPGNIMWAFIALIVMHFLFLRLDKGLMPIKDPKTGLLDSELSDEDRRSKREKVAGTIKFVFANIVVMLVLHVNMRGISILVPMIAGFVICWTVSKIFKKRNRF